MQSEIVFIAIKTPKVLTNRTTHPNVRILNRTTKLSFVHQNSKQLENDHSMNQMSTKPTRHPLGLFLEFFLFYFFEKKMQALKKITLFFKVSDIVKV